MRRDGKIMSHMHLIWSHALHSTKLDHLFPDIQDDSEKNLTLLWRFILGTDYIKQNNDLLYLTKELNSFHKNFIS